MLRAPHALAFLLSLVACSDPEPSPRSESSTSSPPPEQPTSPAQAPSQPAPAPSAPAPAASAIPQGALPKPPARGCVLGEQIDLRAGRGRALLSLHAGQPAALIVPDDNRALEWWSGSDGRLTRRAALPVDEAIQRFATLAHERSTFVAWVDLRGTLWLSEIAEDRFGPPRALAHGLDRRFAPSLAHASGLLVAFTRSVDELMHTQLARVHGGRVAIEDLTPAGHGAAAGTFVHGAASPSLVMIDARAGVSPLLEVRFDAQGNAQPAQVRTPVSQPYAPPALAAVALSPEHVEVAFSAIGHAAATAIGRVPLYRAEAPAALVPSKGYGELQFSAARGTRAALFAVDAFTASTKDAPRALSIKLLDTQGEGGTLILRPADPRAHAPSLTPGFGPGEFWLAYTTDETVHLAHLACDA